MPSSRIRTPAADVAFCASFFSAARMPVLHCAIYIVRIQKNRSDTYQTQVASLSLTCCLLSLKFALFIYLQMVDSPFHVPLVYQLFAHLLRDCSGQRRTKCPDLDSHVPPLIYVARNHAMRLFRDCSGLCRTRAALQ